MLRLVSAPTTRRALPRGLLKLLAVVMTDLERVTSGLSQSWVGCAIEVRPLRQNKAVNIRKLT